MAGVARPTGKEVVGLEKECGADGVRSEGAGDGGLRGAESKGRLVNLGLATVGEGDVDLHKELAAGEGAALGEPGPGQDGLGDGDPDEALGLGEGAPTFGDGAEVGADGALGGATGVERDEGGVADWAVAVALPDEVAAFSRFGVRQFHDCAGGYVSEGRGVVKAGIIGVHRADNAKTPRGKCARDRERARRPPPILRAEGNMRMCGPDPVTEA